MDHLSVVVFVVLYCFGMFSWLSAVWKHWLSTRLSSQWDPDIPGGRPNPWKPLLRFLVWSWRGKPWFLLGNELSYDQKLGLHHGFIAYEATMERRTDSTHLMSWEIYNTPPLLFIINWLGSQHLWQILVNHPQYGGKQQISQVHSSLRFTPSNYGGVMMDFKVEYVQPLYRQDVDLSKGLKSRSILALCQNPGRFQQQSLRSRETVDQLGKTANSDDDHILLFKAVQIFWAVAELGWIFTWMMAQPGGERAV